MIRIIAKLIAITVVLIACLPVQPSSAEGVAFVSGNGNDANPCTAAQPCASISKAITLLGNGGGRVVCQTPVLQTDGYGFVGSYVFDCPSTSWPGEVTILPGPPAVLKFQHIDFSGLGTKANVIFVAGGGGTLIFDDCVFEDVAGVALDIEPGTALNLVIKNSRISNNTAAGVLIKPAAGGSVTATFDGVTITKNAGGLKTDSTNGAVRVDISNSTISDNANNGVIAIGGAGGQNMVSVGSGVIASNGQAGIEASGGTAAVLVNNTLLDSNAGGAISAVSGGRILTYQNNRTIGLPGTGFTGTASPN
jgi:hypothetical protein